MGLDMYAYTIEQDRVGEHEVSDTLPADFRIAQQADDIDFAYWRNFNHLDDFMSDLYYDKGGEKAFNCELVRVELKDLDIIKEMLDYEEYGIYPIDDETLNDHAEYTYDFINRAKEAINQGMTVWYGSWW